MHTEADAPKSVGGFLLRVFQGIIIGSGAILPGISGGVLCVTFGLYQPMMSLLAHPLLSFKSAWRLFLPIVIGWAAGFWIFAKLLEMLFASYALLAVALFIGLIAGSFPSLLNEANREGRSVFSWISFALSTIVMLIFFLALEGASTSLNLTPNFGWFFFCGVLWGLSLIVPGMSSSSLLIYMGLYEPMTSGIAAFSPAVLIPMLLGICACVFPFARLVNNLFERHYASSFYAVVGFVVASTLTIVPRSFQSASDAILAVLVAAAGFILAYGSERLTRKKTR
ncbi:MAG: DUF368 domain-containing protein [Clostridiaceae bacterium]|nr:DUF368 domain-containing protein [Clostridiaceae bacterium]